LRWLIPGRVAAARDENDLDASINTILLIGRDAFGRRPDGRWKIGRPISCPARPRLFDVQSIVDLLRYEWKMQRVVAIIGRPPSVADLYVECLGAAHGLPGAPRHRVARWYARALARDGEARIRRREARGHPLLRASLVHTTSTDALPAIVETGVLKSPALLRKGKRTASIGAKMFKEPADYADYVMFGWPTRIGGEMVVNSRRLGHFYGDRKDDNYIPGVRLYFSRERLESDAKVVFDGIHALKIRGQVPLAENLLAVATADTRAAAVSKALRVPVLRPRSRTPQRYVAESNRLFVRTMARRAGHHRVPKGIRCVA